MGGVGEGVGRREEACGLMSDGRTVPWLCTETRFLKYGRAAVLWRSADGPLCGLVPIGSPREHVFSQRVMVTLC